MSGTIIEWDRHRVIVARGSAVGKTTALESVTILERPAAGTETATFSNALKPLLPVGSAKSPATVGIVLARQSVTFHRIQLPVVPDHELPDMVRLQAAMRLTVPVETVCLDFAPLPVVAGSPTRDVLLVTAPVEQINVIRKLLAAHQVILSSVRVSSFCIAEAAADAGLLTPQNDPSVVDAMVLMRSDFIEVTFVRGMTVEFSHSGASWTSEDGIERAVRSELSRARMAASESLGDHKVGRLMLIGRPSVTSAVSDEISARMDNAPVERIDPAITFLSGTLPTGVTSDEVVAVAGAIAADRNKAVESVDLINPRRAPEKRDLRRVKVLAGTLAALVIFGAVWNWRQGRINALEAESGDLRSQVADLQSTLSMGKADSDVAAAVREWVDRDINWLEEMTRLKELLPGTDRMIVKTFSFGLKNSENSIGTIRIDGKSKTVSDVDSLARRLTDAGYAVSPPDRGESQRDANYPIELSIQITIPVRQAATAQSPSKPQKPATAVRS